MHQVARALSSLLVGLLLAPPVLVSAALDVSETNAPSGNGCDPADFDFVPPAIHATGDGGSFEISILHTGACESDLTNHHAQAWTSSEPGQFGVHNTFTIFVEANPDEQERSGAVGILTSEMPLQLVGEVAVTQSGGHDELHQDAFILTEPQITSFRFNGANAGPLELEHSVTLTIAWASLFTEGCTGLGTLPGWTGSNLSSQGQSTHAPSPGSFQVGLRCSDSEGNFVDRGPYTILVAEDEGPAPGDCNYIPSLTQASGGALQRTEDVLLDQDWGGYFYEYVFGDSWPGLSIQRQFRLHPYRYASMFFVTPSDLNSTHTGGWSFEGMAGTASGTRLISISTCPGDFDAANLDARCLLSLPIGADSFNWRGGNVDSRCPLEPGKAYYLNIIYSQSPPGTAPNEITWDCSSAERCGNIVTPYHNYQ